MISQKMINKEKMVGFQSSFENILRSIRLTVQEREDLEYGFYQLRDLTEELNNQLKEHE